jgi:quercetin dioxygenase-like cupin family protein
MIARLLSAALLAATSFSVAPAHDISAAAAKVTVVYDHELPNVPGKSIKGVLVEYGPGGTSPAHIHPPSAFIYATVLEGAIRSQVNDGRW